jgi:hypothetical protein
MRQRSPGLSEATDPPTVHPQHTHSAPTAHSQRRVGVPRTWSRTESRCSAVHRAAAWRSAESRTWRARYTHGVHTRGAHMAGSAAAPLSAVARYGCSNGGGQALLWQGPGVCVRMMGWAHAAKGDGGLGGARLLHQRRERKLERTPTSPGCGREQRLVCCGLRIDLALPRAVAPRHVSVKRE